MTDLRIVEDGLIPIYANPEGEHIVSARELYDFLRVGRDFPTWFHERIVKYGFVHGVDFSPKMGKSAGGRPSSDYYLTIGMGKELGMVENNDQGRQVRRYFIAVEEQFKQAAAQIVAPTQGKLLVAMAQAFEAQEQRLIALEAREAEANATREQQAAQLTTLGHRVANLDLTNIEGTPRQRLVKMIQRYACQAGVPYPTAWHHFDASFNLAFRTNLTLRRQHYAQARNLTQIDRATYLEAKGQIEDGIRVADKMLNGPVRQPADEMAQ